MQTPRQFGLLLVALFLGTSLVSGSAVAVGISDRATMTENAFGIAQDRGANFEDAFAAQQSVNTNAQQSTTTNGSSFQYGESATRQSQESQLVEGNQSASPFQSVSGAPDAVFSPASSN
jgi:hypothetical protein